ncbi:MAG: family 16 glycoside hydrolase, partial [Chitinophagaceae bacterium]
MKKFLPAIFLASSVASLAASTLFPVQAMAQLAKTTLRDMPANKLTSSEKVNGWKQLFDGKTMKGWRTYQNKKSDSWTVVNGDLYCKGSTSDKSDLRS